MSALTPVHAGNGDFTRSPETVARDAEAARMRSRSMTYQQIGDALGVSRQAAHQMVQRAMAETLAEPAAAVRQFELDKLDAAERLVLAALDRKHYVVSHGKVIRFGEDADALEDDGFVLSAVAHLIRISESRRKLLGLDAPQKVEQTGEFTYQLVGVDPDVL